MKYSILLLFLTFSFVIHAQDKEEIPPLPKIPNMPKIEQHKGEVKKVFFAMQGDAKFMAYVVLWKGQEIVITDMMGAVPKEKGDEISFISMVMKMPNLGGGVRKSILQFSVMPDVKALIKNKD